MIRNTEFSSIKVRRVRTTALLLYSRVLKCQARTSPSFLKSHIQLVKNVPLLLHVSCFDFVSSHCFLARA